MRAVFDAAIYVTAIAIPGSLAERAVRMAIEGRFELLLPRSTLDDVLGTLAGHFARDAEELARAAIFLTSLAEPIESALGAESDVVVTSASLRPFLERVQNEVRQPPPAYRSQAWSPQLSSDELAFLADLLKRGPPEPVKAAA